MRRGLVCALTLSTLVFAGLAGCITEGSGPEPPEAAAPRLQVYEYRYAGDDMGAVSVPYGWLARIANTGNTPVLYAVSAYGPSGLSWGLATDQGYEPDVSQDGIPRPDLVAPDTLTNAKTLEPGASALWLFHAQLAPGGDAVGFAVRFSYEGGARSAILTPDTALVDEGGRVRGITLYDRQVTLIDAGQQVQPGDHVLTRTVGVWTNGTSFYTNVADFAADDAFPVGFTDPIDGAPLPVYVFREARTEQPAGSKDNCYFTTITGYNMLMRTQVGGSTSVRYLTPEEAYTRPGAEDHALYGDALVFLNTVVSIVERTTVADSVPDPAGACFNPMNGVPPLPVPVPPNA